MDSRAHERLLFADKIARMEMQTPERRGPDPEDELLSRLVESQMSGMQSRRADERRFRFGEQSADSAATRAEAAAVADSGRRETAAVAASGRGRSDMEFEHELGAEGREKDRTLEERMAESKMEAERATTAATTAGMKRAAEADSPERYQRDLAGQVLVAKYQEGEEVNPELAQAAGLSGAEIFGSPSGLPRDVRVAQGSRLSEMGDPQAGDVASGKVRYGDTAAFKMSAGQQALLDEAAAELDTSPSPLDRFPGDGKPWYEAGIGQSGYFDLKTDKEDALRRAKILKAEEPNKYATVTAEDMAKRYEERD